MKLLLFVIISAILSTVNCTICYKCIDGDQSHVIGSYKTCNKFLDNHTCNTTSYSDACVTYVSDYLHKRTTVYDCWTEMHPFRSGQHIDTNICKSNYCNRDENWGRYNKATSVTLQTSLALILISSLCFL
ncbi:uncharacterized protein LOC122506073 [Leptopilina heterotoma]|uniref:uncharacterized protein LOC122506073 n=1 Tax=Leptopilina heterotoma TaxID=63436 RepID=UPI001CA90AB4|nr:uncharacterized protein LOC122506073 [Leptopilina heterotoma]